MSSGEVKFSYSMAKTYAEQVIGVMGSECERIAVAGSLRRMKREVGDVEIVLIPKDEEQLVVPTIPAGQGALFDDLHKPSLARVYGHGRIERRLFMYNYEFLKTGPYFKKVKLGSMAFDIFLTTPAKWGVIFTIRTGSAYFSHKLVTPRSHGGMCPSNLGFQDGRIWRGRHVEDSRTGALSFRKEAGTEPLDTPEEDDVFKALGLAWVPPEKRM